MVKLFEHQRLHLVTKCSNSGHHGCFTAVVDVHCFNSNGIENSTLNTMFICRKILIKLSNVYLELMTPLENLATRTLLIWASFLLGNGNYERPRMQCATSFYVGFMGSSHVCKGRCKYFFHRNVSNERLELIFFKVGLSSDI